MNPSQETVALSELETHHAELVARVADSQATVSAAAEVIRLRSDDSQRVNRLLTESRAKATQDKVSA